MKRTSVIASGERAFHLISEPAFLHEWLDLFAACSWGTVFQSPDFVKVWYETYREQFVPVILSMTDQKGQLRGLLTLATSRSTGQLVYAGDVLSEYQVWLARDDAKDTFIFEAFDLLGETWPRQVLRLRYLPPRTHLGALENTHWIKNRCFLRPASRPVISLDEEQRIDRSLKAKQVKLNRLGRLGAVSFREVTRVEFAEIFERAWPLYEFRQIGQYNSSPFLTDADLKPFLLAVAGRSDLLHMTVLQVDEAIVAWLLGIKSSGYLHLIATGYSPFHARHSPGMLHMLMLAKRLIQERRVFDLTPGGDKYKDQLATEHEITHALYFFPHLRAAIKYQHTRDLAKKAIKKAIRIVIKNPARALANTFPWRWRDAAVPDKPPFRDPEISYRLHKFGSLHFAEPDERRLGEVRKNRIADLIRYESTHAKSRRDFVSEAVRFIDQGADVYTLMRNGRLVASCWIVSGERISTAGLAISGAPAGTARLVGLYAHVSEDRAKDAEYLHAKMEE